VSTNATLASGARWTKRRHLALLVIAGVFVGVLAMLYLIRETVIAHGPGGSGVLARVTTSSGCEVVLSQRWNLQPFEPYTVALWLREPGKEWGWCYVGHEEHRWTDFALAYDREHDQVSVLNDGTLRARLECSSFQFATYDWRGSYRHTVPAPQERRAPDWQ
jgi:hypothetical protein